MVLFTFDSRQSLLLLLAVVCENLCMLDGQVDGRSKGIDLISSLNVSWCICCSGAILRLTVMSLRVSVIFVTFSSCSLRWQDYIWVYLSKFQWYSPFFLQDAIITVWSEQTNKPMRTELDKNLNPPITVLTVIHVNSQFSVFLRKVCPRWMPIMSIIIRPSKFYNFVFIGKAQ